MSLAFLFPGQASQFVGMGRALAEVSESARRRFEQANDALGFDLRAACFDGPEERLRRTSVTQPAVYTHSAVAFEALRERGIVPSVTAGHSVGEIAALFAAGVFEFESGLAIVAVRGRAMEQAGEARPGTMAALIGVTEEQAIAICEDAPGNVWPANFNSPEQVVISGEVEAVRAAVDLAGSRGAKRAVELPVSGAFHTELMAPAAERLREVLDGTPFARPRIPVVPNVTAEPETDPERLRALLIRQLTRPVLWSRSIGRVLSDGIREMAEVGPGSVLKGLVRRIDREARVICAGDPQGIEELARYFQGG
jgi:[acyl-carrier-protein] S-malonyltransferase